MVKLKVIKLFDLKPGFNMYVIDFVREAGQTKAICISEDNKIENWDIEYLEIDFESAINS